MAQLAVSFDLCDIDLVYECLDTCCSHFLTCVDLHFRHESELPVC